jgi:hypothetical protein
MVPFIYPTEIFPVSVRAFGNGFGVAGYLPTSCHYTAIGPD